MKNDSIIQTGDLDTTTSVKKEKSATAIVEEHVPLDSLSIDSLLINGIPFHTTSNKLVKVFGKPDSIIKPNYECGSFAELPKEKELKQYWYNGSNFHIVNNKAEIDQINFSDSNFCIQYPLIKLSIKTNIDDIKVLFPNSYKESNFWKDPTTGYTYQLVRLSPGRLYDSMFVLRFKDKKLVKFDLWNPC